MHNFNYRNEELWCEELPIYKVASEIKTPFYLYSYNTLNRHYRVFDDAFADIPHLICFAVKANSSLAILKMFANKGSGADVVSGGELYKALKVGINPQKIVYAGVGKTAEEIKSALNSNILMFNIESTQELILINNVAKTMKVKARIALRVTPEVETDTHDYISTGSKKNKFGINFENALEEYKFAASLENIEIAGVHIHIGSQITEIKPFKEALDKIVYLIFKIKKLGIDVKYIDIGGGLGITYRDETPPYPKEFAEAILPYLKGLDCILICEPGRVIVGNAGILVTKVLYTKNSGGKNFIIVDAGMNDFIRPSLYDSYQEILPVYKKITKNIVADVVGPICESGDFMAKDRNLPEFKQGDYMAIMSAGAYGFTMSSNYNSRPRTAEVMVKDDQFYVIRKRESYEDLIRGEEIPPFLKG